jgi:hypothetical protein
MKRAVFIIIGALIGLIVGIVFSIPFNYWYTKNFVDSLDDALTHISFLILLIYPLFMAAGAFYGFRYYNHSIKSKKNFGVNRF